MTKPSTWYYAVVGLSLLWALVGCYSYLAQVMMTPADIAQLPAAQRELMAAMPDWLTSLYALTVWIGLAGAICLLLRLKFARSAFAVSLVCIVVMFGYLFVATPMIASMGVSSTYFPIFIFVAGVAELWFAQMATARGWLR